MGPDDDRLDQRAQRALVALARRRERQARPPVPPAWVVNVAMRRAQERRLARLNDPRWEWARGLVARRVAVAAWLVLALAVLAWWAWWLCAEGRRGAPQALLLVLAVAAAVPLAGALLLLRTQAIRGLLDLPIEQLTERQRRLRERTDRLAGRLTLVVLAAGLVTVAAAGGRLDEAGAPALTVVLLALCLPVPLPTLVAAWIAPDDRALHAARIPGDLRRW
jgi:hypothetical protein